MVNLNSDRGQSEALFKRASRVIPGGVDSPVRAFRTVGGSPPFIERGEGCRVWDRDGNSYIDYIGSWGPLILGHAHPSVVQRLQEAAALGFSFGLPSRLEGELAEAIIGRFPSVEKIRFVNSGTEAAMSAIRLARAFTGRDKVIKFAGCYHGHADSFLAAAGSGAATFGLPDSPGVTVGAARDTLIARFNDLDSAQNLFSQEVTRYASINKKDGVAAVIVEPVAGNMGVIPPEEGFLEGLRALCSKQGSLLIFDEVITGFRVAKGGAQELFGIRPDMTLFGKIIGGGLPVGAFGGRAEVMNLLAPEGPVYQAGTLSGNPLAMTAGLATLAGLDVAAYKTLEAAGASLQQGLEQALKDFEIQGVVQRVGSMLTLFFTDSPVRHFDDAARVDHRRFAEFHRRMLERGVLLPPSGYEAWFISIAHDEEAVEKTIAAAREALKEL